MRQYNLETISEKLIESLDDLLREFGIDYTDHGDRVSFACPIHHGDNPEGCSILKKDVGNWQCFTQKCHEQYGSSIINFIRALLSVNQQKDIPFRSTLEWCASLVGESSVERDPIEDKFKTEFIQLYKYVTRNREAFKLFKPRQYVRNELDIPAQYYVDRGFSPEIIDKYDVGYCGVESKPMFERVVIPIYDDDGEYMIGCSGRTIHPKCEECNGFHAESDNCDKKVSKWKHVKDFDSGKCLYNYWEAKRYIQDTKTVVLVEGPADVWKLEEASIHMGLAIFGTAFTDTHSIILEESGAFNVVIIMDNDEAGQKARKKIENKLNRLFNIYHIHTDQNDLGDSNMFYIRSTILPFVEKIYDKV